MLKILNSKGEEVMPNLSIKIIGPAQNINCFGLYTREIAFALSSMGENVGIADTTAQGDFPVKLSEEDTNRLNQLKGVKIEPPFIAIHVNAAEKINFVDNSAVANIVWTASDVLGLPLISSLILGNVLIKEVWTTPAQKPLFDKYDYLANKTQAIQFGVNTSKFNPSLIDKYKQAVSFRNDDSFYFGFIGSLKYTTGFDLVLRAFFEEFKDEPKAKLVFKTFMGNLPIQQEKELAARIINDYKRNSNAELSYITGSQNDEFMTILHHSIDCLVSPARGKTWANSIIKCMAAGVPTIVNQHAGNKSYTGKDTNYILSSSKTSLIKNIDWLSQNIIHQGYDWSEPNFEELKKTMRDVFTNRNELKEMASRARNRVEKLEWKVIAMEVLKNIKKFN